MLDLSFSSLWSQDLWGPGVIVLALLLGGLLKGATGLGMPLVVVPVIATVYDIRLAVVLLTIPNFISNIWQSFNYRDHALPNGIERNLAIWGLIGSLVGTVILVSLPVAALNILMALIIVIYIALRLTNPSFRLSMALGKKLSHGAGLVGGVLQGAIGISAPMAVTFVSSLRVERPVFVRMISVFFASTCIAQLPLLAYYGLLTWSIAALSIMTMIPLACAIPLGDWIGKKLGAVVFDRLILALLAILAAKQVFDVMS